MRADEFKFWLGQIVADTKTGKLSDHTKDIYLENIRTIEEEDGFDLDEEFDKDGFESILKRYTYGKKDERNGRKNPTNLNIKQSELYETLGRLKTVLKHYLNFRFDNPD